MNAHDDLPAPVLKPGALYWSDNARLICSECAGFTALYTGHDLSGQRGARVTLGDVEVWLLSWCLNRRFDAGCSADLLIKAGAHLEAAAEPPTLLVDGGVENCNKDVDAVVEPGLLKRVLAQTEISFSNSLIQAWRRVLKHNWLFLNSLDSEARVRHLVKFYIAEHNQRLPHAAFKGQTPEETYFGTGDAVPDQLAVARVQAQHTRFEENRAKHCALCN